MPSESRQGSHENWGVQYLTVMIIYRSCIRGITWNTVSYSALSPSCAFFDIARGGVPYAFPPTRLPTGGVCGSYENELGGERAPECKKNQQLYSNRREMQAKRLDTSNSYERIITHIDVCLTKWGEHIEAGI